MADEAVLALKARSLRSIRMELEFLAETSVISQNELSNILSNLPPIPDFGRPIGSAGRTQNNPNSSSNNIKSISSAFDSPASRNQHPLVSPVLTPASAPAPAQQSSPPPIAPPPESAPPSQVARSQTEPPSQELNNMHLFHRQTQPQQQQQYAAPPSAPPAYSSVQPVLCIAQSVYAYQPADAGDLELHPNDWVQVTERLNNDWWRGRNERSGAEGIFPRTYVNVVEEKHIAAPPPLPPFQPQFAPINAPSPGPMSYGNMPLAVAQQPVAPAPVDQQQQQEQGSSHLSKVEEGGKKFGKKLGNAAIFGAGATIGSNIVNSIF